MRELATIVVPVFGAGQFQKEKPLLLHAHLLMPGFSIVFVCADSCEASEFQREFPGSTVYKFDNEFFVNQQSFSRLLLRPDFYDRFGWSEFLLFLGPSVYITKNELHYWCKQGHDYICDITGQLSLRNVDKFLSLVKKGQREIQKFLNSNPQSDREYWQKKVTGFWPSLRSPTPVVSDYFSLPIDAVLNREKIENLPFAVTGLDMENTVHRNWMNKIEIKQE